MDKKRDGVSRILLVILGALSIFLGIDLLERTGLSDDSAPVPTAVPAARAGWYEIYFTNPTCPPEREREGGVDENIAADLLQASQQVDIATYELNSEPITNALIELRRRGVTVRVVTDEDNGNLSAIRRLRRHGISVVEDRRSGLMHNKFIVIDGRITWTGSMNFTSNGVFCNNNNMVRIDNPRFAANYLAEMGEMYDMRQFGPTSPINTPNEQLVIQGISVETYFSAEKDVTGILATALAGAQQEILFMAFSFTDDLLGETMLARAEAGVQVQGVFETLGSDTSFSFYPIMQAVDWPNLQVRRDGNPRMMHHKVLIIDRHTVVFGSFNFTDSANRRNDENVVIVHDPTFASYFVEEFDAVWAEAGG